MIWVTRLRGQAIVLNADLIETIEATPDTVVTMIDGRKYMVEEPPDRVVELVVQYRTALLHGRAPERTGTAGLPPRASLHLIDEKRRND
jgi:flagellar protein FlbD